MPLRASFSQVLKSPRTQREQPPQCPPCQPGKSAWSSQAHEEARSTIRTGADEVADLPARLVLRHLDNSTDNLVTGNTRETGRHLLLDDQRVLHMVGGSD